MAEFTLAQFFTEEFFEQQVLPLLLESSFKLLRFVLVLAAAAIVAGIASKVASRVVKRVVTERSVLDERQALEHGKRTQTLAGVAERVVRLGIWIPAGVMAMSEIGFNIGPLLAGAGVAGLAIGFGAQNLVRDLFTGFFMLAENQVRVGDVAVINGTGGLVEEINLRTIVLRDLEGVVHVFPNGTINTLSNRTREFSCYVFDVGVAYKEDADRVIEVIKEVGAELAKDEEYGPLILDAPEVFGLDRFADSAIVIKGRIRTVPIRQWFVGREFNRRLKRRFDDLGIEIPFPHRTLFVRSLPFDENRDRLREMIREELAAVQSGGSKELDAPDAGGDGKT